MELDDATISRARETLTKVPWIGPEIAAAVRFVPVGEGTYNKIIGFAIAGRRLAFRVPTAPESDYDEFFDEEEHNMRRAAMMGIAPTVHYFDRTDGSLILDFVDVPHLKYKHFRDSAVLERAAKTYRIMHDGPMFLYKHDAIRRIDKNLPKMRQLPLKERAYVYKLMPRVKRITSAYRVLNRPFRPCHNDPFPRNMFDLKTHVVFIDWQVSGMADHHIELGGFCNQAELNSEQEEILVRAHGDCNIERLRLGRVINAFYFALRACKDVINDPDDKENPEWAEKRLSMTEDLLNRPETELALKAIKT